MNAIDLRPGLPRLNALSEILTEVAAAYGISPVDITGRKRTKAIAEARCLVCLLAKRCTRLSLGEVGILLRRDHTTIYALIRSAESRQAMDPWFAAVSSSLIDQFCNREPRL